jgi:hypothetical protein
MQPYDIESASDNMGTARSKSATAEEEQYEVPVSQRISNVIKSGHCKNLKKVIAIT